MLWKTVTPMFSNKCIHRESKTLVTDDKVFSEDLEVVDTFNVFFLEHSKRDKPIFRPGTSD